MDKALEDYNNSVKNRERFKRFFRDHKHLIITDGRTALTIEELYENFRARLEAEQSDEAETNYLNGYTFNETDIN